MPHYFIDTDDDDTAVVDEAGQDLLDDEAARRLALACLPDMANSVIPNGDRRTFSASVRNEGGTVLYRATLSLVGQWMPDYRKTEPESGSNSVKPSDVE